MSCLIVIPARMESSRFPGKPLARINGKEMIWHVRSRCSGLADCRVVVATCNKEIEDFCIENDWEVIMTSKEHERATDRACEALDKIEASERSRFRYIVMVQGDEPLVRSGSIKRIIEDLESGFDIVNLFIGHKSAPSESKNKVKAVVNKDSEVLYLSRSSLPGSINETAKEWIQQTGLIGFSSDALKRFSDMEECELERLESIDMNRWLYNGGKIKAVISQEMHCAVDIREDIDEAERLLNREKEND